MEPKEYPWPAHHDDLPDMHWEVSASIPLPGDQYVSWVFTLAGRYPDRREIVQGIRDNIGEYEYPFTGPHGHDAIMSRAKMTLLAAPESIRGTITQVGRVEPWDMY